ncbi:hypothetical protein GCM10028795_10350 [Lysobacter olei]
MGTVFWIRRFLVVLTSAFLIIAAAHWLRGRGLHYAVTEASLWALITAAVSTAARAYQSRRGQHCAICKDTPESHLPTGGSGQ